MTISINNSLHENSPVHGPDPTRSLDPTPPTAGAVGLDPDRPRRALTEREKRMLCLVCDGLTNAGIAVRLGLSPETIKSELKRIFRKIDAKNRTQAAVLVVKQGLLN